MITKIKEGYNIVYTDDYLTSDELVLKVFSKKEFGDDERFMRKYLSQISSRAYYPSGAKRWFHKLVWMYELRVPKDMLILNVENCNLSYIHYTVKDTKFKLVNNTSGSSGTGDGAMNIQSSAINHCKYVGVRDMKKLLSIAIKNDAGTINTSENSSAFDGYYPTIMFLAKYAPELTDFNKSNYRYSQYRYSNNHVIDYVLKRMINTKTIEYLENYKDDLISESESFRTAENSSLVDRRIKKINSQCEDERLDEIISDIKSWVEISKKEWFGIPLELFEAMNLIKNYKRIKSKIS